MSLQVKQLQQVCTDAKPVTLSLSFELAQASKVLPVSLTAVIRRTPDEMLPIDRLFREGMSLPEVKASAPGELDVVLLIDDEELATFLNLCEGKAHLDLLESKEIVAKLEAKGYRTPIRTKRFVKGLPGDLRALLTPEITEPDIDVFDAFFALPDPLSPSKKKIQGGKPDVPPPPPPPPPPPRIPALLVQTLDDGFRLTANPAYADWPVNVSVSMAYADGSRKPSWSEYDFRPSELKTAMNGCEPSFTKNKLTAKNCGPGCNIEVTGFDARREIDTNIKVWKDAQND
ncbi:hypothetical protein [Mesorhizobium cantuariense]|uniref:Uncharacterized protein n=1 Tax=Mesorhizobium cantuariense TaxID=1300275 RepID=A0ABV7N050_9HYPH